jgi:hypothetical protein
MFHVKQSVGRRAGRLLAGQEVEARIVKIDLASFTLDSQYLDLTGNDGNVGIAEIDAIVDMIAILPNGAGKEAKLIDLLREAARSEEEWRNEMRIVREKLARGRTVGNDWQKAALDAENFIIEILEDSKERHHDTV